MFEDDSYFYMVTEYIEGEDLFDRLIEGKPMDESKIMHIIKVVLETIKVCHSKGICHRDIKPENILIDKQENIKLIDFGAAENIDADKGITGLFGTAVYIAPEIAFKKSPYNEKCDIWSIGVMMHFFLT
jgi:serine/threonine protein kinase